MTVEERVWIGPLAPADVPAASAIEALSMPRPWPEAELLRDLTHNPGALYLGAYSAPADQVRAPDVRAADRVLVGFVGGWRQVDELHVTTIAVHPAWRRRGIGRSLMVHLMSRAIDSGMVFVTLEVRVSNSAARDLYRQLGFQEVGCRRGYYADNGEDALILTTPSSLDRAWRARLDGLQAFVHAYSDG